MVEYKKQVQIIRDLAKQLKDISQQPRYKINRQKWADHNEMKKGIGPLLWICPDDDGGWMELVPESTLQTIDPDLRELEIRIRRMIFHHEHFQDDFVIEPFIRFDIPGEYTGYHYGNANQRTAWGIDIQPKSVGKHAYSLDNYLDEPENIEKLLGHEVDFIIDEAEKRRLQDKYDDVLDWIIKAWFTIPYGVLVQSLLIDLVHLRSMTKLMLDLYDRPEMIAQMLDHMSASKARLLERIEAECLLYNNHTNIYTGSGGLGYTNRNLDESNLKVSELWGFADSQEFSQVSPEMFYEFGLKYQKRGLNMFGYACYGCCEPLDNKYDMIFKEIPNIRRLSVSPWSNVDIAAENIGDRAIFSWKPNPVTICEGFDEYEIQKLVNHTAAATVSCTTEIILKDIRTCGYTPAHIQKFIDIVKRTW